MRSRSRDINVFNLSMLDVISGALGAFLILMLILLPYYDKEAIDYQQEIEQLEEQLAAAEAEAEAAQEEAAEARQQAEEAIERLGLTFESKNLVFVVDISGSMNPAIQPNPSGRVLIDEVRAGIKMLIATMDSTYQFDIVYFPDMPAGRPYGEMWGETRSVTEARKYEAYRFLSGLRAEGGTPTGAAMEHVLTAPTYEDIGTVLLFSDGEPELEGVPTVEALARQITRLNGGGRVINTVGVGDGFLDPASASEPEVEFLRSLARLNEGFFIGF